MPMTLMNRLFGDWTRQPYAFGACKIPGLDRLTWEELLESLRDELFDVRTGRGGLLLFNPGRMKSQSGLGVVALASNWEDADDAFQRRIPEKLARIVSQRACA